MDYTHLNPRDFAMVRHFAIATALVGCAIGVPLLFAQAQSPVKVALLIGVNEYDKRGFAKRPLKYAERDKDDPQTLLSLTDLLGKLDRKGGTNLVLVDACRDDPGRGARSISGNELNGKLPAITVP